MADFNVTKDNLKDYLSKNSTLKVEYDQYKKQHAGESEDAIASEFISIFNDNIDGIDNNTADKDAYNALNANFSTANTNADKVLSLGELLTAFNKGVFSEKDLLEITGYKNIDQLRFAVAFTKDYAASSNPQWGQTFEDALAAACQDPSKYKFKDEKGDICVCESFDSRPVSIYTSNFNQVGGCNLTDNPFVTDQPASVTTDNTDKTPQSTSNEVIKDATPETTDAATPKADTPETPQAPTSTHDKFLQKSGGFLLNAEIDEIIADLKDSEINPEDIADKIKSVTVNPDGTIIIKTKDNCTITYDQNTKVTTYKKDS